MKKYTVEVHDDGEQHWKNEDGDSHREDGPAVICPDGRQFWFHNGKYHRDDGPAVIYADGRKYWYYHGKRHREDGPAVILSDGTQYWYINGKQLSEKEFNARKNTCVTGKVVVIDGVEYKLVPNKG